MWNVINLCYGDNLGCAQQMSVFDTVSHLFQLEQQLIDWKRRLPSSLTLRQSVDILSISSPLDSIPSSLERFPVVLTLRYHNLRILLHRPVLVMFLDITGTSAPAIDAQELTLLKQIGSNSIQICVQSSMEIISIVSALVTSTGLRGTWLGAWWFSLYYTYNAALVIFASLLIIQDRDISGSVISILPVSAQELRKCLDEAMVALRQLDSENRMVERCANYLGQLTSVLDVLSTSSLVAYSPSNSQTKIPSPFLFFSFLSTLISFSFSSIPTFRSQNQIHLTFTFPTATSTTSLPALPHNLDSASVSTSSNPQSLLRPPPYSTDATPGSFTGYAHNPMISNASPPGMDLGEFMLEDDIEFLNQLASAGILSRSATAGVGPRNGR